MLLFLVRHALTPITGKKLTGWLPGISLSEEGRAQAEATAKRLIDVPLSAVYSSPLERCVETAEIITAGRGLAFETRDDIGEIKYGEWQGRTLVSLYKSRAWKDLKARPADFRFPGGETIREAQTRGMAAIEDIRRAHKNKAVMVCSHADMIRVLVAGYIGLPLDLYDRIAIAPASVTVLYLTEGTPRLLRLGDSDGFNDVIDRMKAAAGKRPAGKR